MFAPGLLTGARCERHSAAPRQAALLQRHGADVCQQSQSTRLGAFAAVLGCALVAGRADGEKDVNDWDQAYLSLRRSDAIADAPSAWDRVEIPVLTILLVIAILATLFGGNL